MSADFKKLEERVENTIQPDSLAQTTPGTIEHMRALGELINKRFDYVIAKLDDINSNLIEMKNILAFLVEKQK